MDLREELGCVVPVLADAAHGHHVDLAERQSAGVDSDDAGELVEESPKAFAVSWSTVRLSILASASSVAFSCTCSLFSMIRVSTVRWPFWKKSAIAPSSARVALSIASPVRPRPNSRS